MKYNGVYPSYIYHFSTDPNAATYMIKVMKCVKLVIRIWKCQGAETAS